MTLEQTIQTICSEAKVVVDVTAWSSRVLTTTSRNDPSHARGREAAKTALDLADRASNRLIHALRQPDQAAAHLRRAANDLNKASDQIATVDPEWGSSRT